ncbi:MAG TPA: hypothetical protein VMO47_06045 [Rhodothermales bacterium]|nr:hypothetical protein [Rhodothermales bacterium]
MEWSSFFVGKLEQSFDVVYLAGPDGVLYGAGSPVDAVEILRLAVGSEEMEHYPDVLVDDWGVFHLLDQVFGIEALIVFDFDAPDGQTTSVRYDLLDIDGDRVFVSMKIGGGPLSFIAAADKSAAGKLISSLLLTLLGTDTAFGEHDVGGNLPIGVTNYRPDLLSAGTVRKGIELLVWHQTELGVSSLDAVRAHVRRFGNPVLRSALGAHDSGETEASRRDLVDLYVESIYIEME